MVQLWSEVRLIFRAVFVSASHNFLLFFSKISRLRHMAKTLRSARKHFARLMSRYGKFMVTVNNERSEKLKLLQQEIDTKHKECLAWVIGNIGSACSEEFAQYCKMQWEDDQRRNSSGSKSNRSV